MFTLDQQLGKLDKEVKFCKNCVVSNQRPRTTFNEDGICSACQWAYEKNNTIDWKLREKELIDLLDKHRKGNGDFDIIVPSSGQKDSAIVAHQLKHKYNMNPLCITWAPSTWTSIGRENLQGFAMAGFSSIISLHDAEIHIIFMF